MRKQNAAATSFAAGPLKSIALGVLIGGVLGFVFISSVETIIRSGTTRTSTSHRELHGGRLGILAADKLPDGRSTSVTGKQKMEQTSIHTLCTSNGSPYLNIQTRIMYGTYKLVQGMPGGESLVGFTRILHRTQPDAVMSEIPTFRADPLTPECDDWCEFPVSDRPNAVAQFFQAAKADPDMIKAPWLLMLEGDYVWMKPLPAPRADSDAPSWAFPFDYIVPQERYLESVMRIMYPESAGPLSDIPPSGPAPVLMRLHEWQKVIPDWERLTAHIEAHKDTKEALGWVREMYAFSIATALQGIRLKLELPGSSPLVAQPPHDAVQGNASLLHYTWSTLVEEGSEKVWMFDKREYVASDHEKQVPLIPLPPLFKEGWKLHKGQPYTQELHNTTLQMLRQMNRAIVDLPTL